MDLSIRNITNHNKILNFKGIKGEYDAKCEPVFRFTLPSYSSDEKPYLELHVLNRELDKNGVVTTNRFLSDDAYLIDFDGKTTIDIPQSFFADSFEEDEDDEIKSDKAYIETPIDKELVKPKAKKIIPGYDAIGYRFVFKKEDGSVRYATDANKTAKISGEQLNLIEIGKNFGVTPQAGSMYHAFIDSVGYDPKNYDPKLNDFIRTHANKLGGTIKGMTLLLKHGYYDSYKYIISTPDIGADPTSPHKYWPNNQYQCSNMQDFKDFNYELFKRGKGYVADGAFTSQSLQSPMVQHVIKWGKQSPFYHMLKVDDKIQLGVLPEGELGYKNVGIRLVNSPKSPDYVENRPTYIQFVDDRLLSDEQRIDFKKPISAYGKSNPDDHYDSVSYNDTVHPFYFEIEHDELDKKLKIFNGKNYLMLAELTPEQQSTLLEFPGGDITERYLAANATCWDGNVDIIKMNLSNPEFSNEDNVQGFLNAREYIHGVATFWTETIQSDLIKRASRIQEKDLIKIAQRGGIDEEEYQAIKENVLSGDFKSLVLEQNKQITDYVEEFPLQSIETSPELSAIFSEPEFKKELLDNKTKNLLIQYVDEIIENSIPSEYKDSPEYKTYAIKTYANEIIKSIYSQAILRNSVDESGVVNVSKLREEATLKSILDHTPINVEDERRQVVTSIKRNLKEINNDAIQVKIDKELSTVKLLDFKMAEAVVLQTKSGLNWRFDAAKDIGDLASTMGQFQTTSFNNVWNGIGKDPGVKEFWSEFVKRIRTYNPSAYIISEITNIGENLPWNDMDALLDYDPILTNTFVSQLRDEILEQEPDSELAMYIKLAADTSQSREIRVRCFNKALNILYKNDYGKNHFESFKNYENNVPWRLEQYFLEQTGSTTSSRYDKYFNSISSFVGINPEKGESSIKNNTARVDLLKEATEHMIRYSQPNNALLSHTFVDNHDKPRVMHAMPLNMNIFLAGLNMNVIGRKYQSLADIGKKEDEKDKKESIKDKKDRDRIIELTGRKELEHINPMGAAVGLMMYDKINESDFSDEEKSKLKMALRDLVNGGKEGEYDSRRARAFGFLPYEITIKDLFKGAEIDDEEKIEKFTISVMEEPMYLQDKIWQVLTALVGVPTLYYGTEYAQTGYETYSKNEFVGNRNRALYERRQNGIFGQYYDKINAISALSQDPNMTALRNGFPESLNISTDNDIDMYPIYRKDDRNSQVISIITSLGLDKGKLSLEQGYKFGTQINKPVGKINLEDENGKCPLDEGTILKRLIYSPNDKKYVPDGIEYVIKDKAINTTNLKPIIIDDTTAYFYVDKPNNVRFRPSYNGAH